MKFVLPILALLLLALSGCASMRPQGGSGKPVANAPIVCESVAIPSADGDTVTLTRAQAACLVRREQQLRDAIDAANKELGEAQDEVDHWQKVAAKENCA